ncbi:ATPase, T2SS/T4P/T4SS family [Motilimonas pumila]|uniref:FHA domain-containing protein n=1 Tax=Motilimonas pumila TaxID=2303987 RepID=A0A418YAG5_9GAMM|nr:ATPase, T2SS/T4P/T4SS family [Motilimonas pumila]RJG39516.1 FHA domain-containing protein [Motilimonas pumila]
MFYIFLKTKKGNVVGDFPCVNDDCIVGKDNQCLVVLRGWGVAAKHARIYKSEHSLFIQDLTNKSSIKVNGKAVNDYGPIDESDLISIGGYVFTLLDKDADSAIASENTDITVQKPVKNVDLDKADSTVKKNEEVSNILAKELNHWRSYVHRELFSQIDLRRINIDEMNDDELRINTQQWIDDIISSSNAIPDTIDKSLLAKQVLNEAIGLGPLEELLADKDVSEVMVNCFDEIFFEKLGVLEKSPITFTNDKAVLSAIERIVSPIGRRIDESSPMVDARLKDGSRVNAVIPPLALKGPSITIRKFMAERLVAEDLVRFNSIDQRMADFLKLIVLQKNNIVISGGTGSGKTTLLNVLSNYIPDNERIVTVEDAAELKLYQPNLVNLEARPANQEGTGAIPIRDLVKNCLRMRPDRIVVGECRGGEALDMLQAMNTGHDGSLTTTHANSPRDCVSRIEVMVMMSGMDLPVQAIREQIGSAVNFIVQQTRFSCGTRKVTSIAEVSGIENGRLQLGEIFKFNQTGYDSNGKVVGNFIATGLIPDFCENMNKRGLSVDLSLFRESVTDDSLS